MIRKTMLIAVLSTLLVAGSALGATHQGDLEASIFGTVMSADETTAMLGTTFGYFFTDALEAGASVIGMWQEEEDAYFILGQGKYHFMTDSTTVPYVGGFGGGFFDGDTITVYGPLAGIKFFVSETTNLFLEYQYQIMDTDEGEDDETHVLTVGISFVIR